MRQHLVGRQRLRGIRQGSQSFGHGSVVPTQFFRLENQSGEA
jgi:hypothetical protein